MNHAMPLDSPLRRASVAPVAIGRQDYGFVSNVRFVSMVGILAVHAEVVSLTWHGGYLNVAFDQMMKFSTVCFFIISGFLLGDRLEVVAPVTYMRRRLNMVFVPWLFWAGVYLALNLTVDLIARGAAARSFKYHFEATVISSAYWFVPNLLLSLAALLAMRRWLNRAWLGVALGVASTMHGLNLHARWWSDTRHNTALTGFIVFLWLGYQLRRNLGAVRARIDRTPWSHLALAAAITWGLAMAEARGLALARGDDFDFMSTLRVTNVAYSLVVFALLFKVSASLAPAAMNVRKHTFGLYLLHPIVFTMSAKAFKVVAARFVGVAPMEFNQHIGEFIASPAARLAVQLGLFAVLYLTAWALVAALARSSAARLVGAREA